jgi:hypothetical protein
MCLNLNIAPAMNETNDNIIAVPRIFALEKFIGYC